MLHVRLQSGAPDEPDTSDWDAICATPSVEGFFLTLFHEVANFGLPAAVIVSGGEDDIRKIQKGLRGSQALGVEITVITCTGTSDLPTVCAFEARGLAGMNVKGDYKRDYAGQHGE